MSNFILNKLYPLGFKNDFKIMTKTALPLVLFFIRTTFNLI